MHLWIHLLTSDLFFSFSSLVFCFLVNWYCRWDTPALCKRLSAMTFIQRIFLCEVKKSLLIYFLSSSVSAMTLFSLPISFTLSWIMQNSEYVMQFGLLMKIWARDCGHTFFLFDEWIAKRKCCCEAESFQFASILRKDIDL